MTNETRDKLERLLAHARITLRQRFRDWETPIDFEDLIACGVLRKTREGYDVLKFNEVPRHAWPTSKSEARRAIKVDP
jgi:hypothetical protein